MLKVMIVDDEAIMRKGLLTLIDWSHIGCEIVASLDNGQSVLEQYTRLSPDIIISDIRMPGMDGLELCHQLRKMGASCRIILLTAFADFNYAQRAIQYGVSQYVIKSGSIEDIIKAVEECKSQILSEQYKVRSHQDAIVEMFKSVFWGIPYSKKELNQKLHSFNLDKCSCYVSVFEVMQQDPLSEEETEQLFQYAKQMIDHVLNGKLCYLIPITHTRISVILFSHQVPIVTSFFNELPNIFYGFTNRNLYLGISALHSSGLEAASAFQEACDALFMSFYDNQNIHYWEKHSFPEPHQFPVDLDSLNDATRSGNLDACKDYLEKLHTTLLDLQLPEKEIKSLAQTLSNLCEHALIRSGCHIDELDFSLSDWKLEIENCLFFERYFDLLKNLVIQTCHSIWSTLYDSNNLIISTKQYIKNHYQEHITLKDIASALNVHPSYLSRCYKQKTGCTITDTIIQMRIELAQKLLEKGNMKIYEVARTVGIEETTYFSHIFRKHTGVSPKAYQERFFRTNNKT